MGSVVSSARCARPGDEGVERSPSIPRRGSLARSDILRHRPGAPVSSRGKTAFVGPRHGSRETGDGVLEPLEESQGFQWAVAPSGRNAVLRVVGTAMMPRMLARPQQHTCLLQRPRNRRRRRHVGPLVNLVGHSSERTTSESADGDDVRPGAVERDDHEHDQSRNRHCPHVAVRVEKAAPEEVVRIQVMHAKRHEQPRPDHR